MFLVDTKKKEKKIKKRLYTNCPHLVTPRRPCVWINPLEM